MHGKISVIGAGLAGCEAAYQAAKRGIDVDLYEMKPQKKSPAHSSDMFCELVCSNSLRGAALSNAVGLLKEEMRRLDSLVIKSADITSVPAGGALAVDRELFSGFITKTIKEFDNINVISKEVTDITPFLDETTIIATGPLTTDALFESIQGVIGGDYLHFFDAAAPIVAFDSINMDKAFFASRYGKGGDDYINCPMTREEYAVFYEALIAAECAEIKDFERNVFEGCMPVEEMALRGRETLLYGPLKPKGIVDPKTGKEPYAVVQLRSENAARTMWNLVGFQTHLKFPEQRRVFSLIPGLESCEIVRYGVMHRNTYMNSPQLLTKHYSLKDRPNLYFAGQMTGVEGYVESASSGMLAGLFAVCGKKGLSMPEFSDKTACGALAAYISGANTQNFQPMNINYGIMRPLDVKIRKKEEKNIRISNIALEEIECLREQLSAL